MTPEQIYALERPHPALLTHYVLRSLLTGPLAIVMLPVLVVRYYTLRYRFDDQGIHAQWGLLFRREINLTYARVQDIHVRSGIIQRWLGLADLMVQTAASSSGPELTIEGFREHHAIRDFLYTRMRGLRGKGAQVRASVAELAAPSEQAGAAQSELVRVLEDIRDELRMTREALDRRGGT
jgi:putative membrane protein